MARNDATQRTSQEAPVRLTTVRVFNFGRAILARLFLIFLLGDLYLTAYCVTNQSNHFIVFFSLFSVGLIIEGGITIRYGRVPFQNDWFSPCILLFIVVALPPIWIIRSQEWLNYNPSDQFFPGNNSNIVNDHWISPETIQRTCTAFAELLETYSGLSFAEQLLTICLVIVRWIIPETNDNNHLNRFVYLEMLMSHVAIASDIFDFTDSILSDTDRQIKNSDGLKIASLVSYSISLFLFGLNLKAKRKTTMSPLLRSSLWSNGSVSQRFCLIIEFLFDTELWSIILVLCVLDLPFLLFRLVILIMYREENILTIFFSMKNFLIILIDANLIFGYIHELSDQRVHLP